MLLFHLIFTIFSLLTLVTSQADVDPGNLNQHFSGAICIPSAAKSLATTFLDNETVTDLADLFCNSQARPYVGTKPGPDVSAVLAPYQLKPPSILGYDNGIAAQFMFNPDDLDGICEGSVAQCKKQYGNIIETCQYNSHDFAGEQQLMDNCGVWSIIVTNCTIVRIITPGCAAEEYCDGCPPLPQGIPQPAYCNDTSIPLTPYCEANMG